MARESETMTVVRRGGSSDDGQRQMRDKFGVRMLYCFLHYYYYYYYRINSPRVLLLHLLKTIPPRRRPLPLALCFCSKGVVK